MHGLGSQQLVETILSCDSFEELKEKLRRDSEAMLEEIHLHAVVHENHELAKDIENRLEKVRTK